MIERLEQALAYHCAPALAGIKASNLICLPEKEFPGLALALEAYDEAFRPRGVRFTILCECKGRALVLVFRPALLRRALSGPMARGLLREAGYPEAAGLEELLALLCARLRAGEGEFPHEIGLFLDYPPEDVQGFQRCGGRGCKLCGHWKVYGDPEQARRRFRRYDQCRDALCSRLSRGISLTSMFCAA